mmetsp:Transcript_54737/g.169891  ORF Transcript_54737/g.169891 Transcript_54737/m.169891 type:complete len:311 (+) Transcript_54737:83-1015(+)
MVAPRAAAALLNAEAPAAPGGDLGGEAGPPAPVADRFHSLAAAGGLRIHCAGVPDARWSRCPGGGSLEAFSCDGSLVPPARGRPSGAGPAGGGPLACLAVLGAEAVGAWPGLALALPSPPGSASLAPAGAPLQTWPPRPPAPLRPPRPPPRPPRPAAPDGAGAVLLLLPPAPALPGSVAPWLRVRLIGLLSELSTGFGRTLSVNGMISSRMSAPSSRSTSSLRATSSMPGSSGTAARVSMVTERLAGRFEEDVALWPSSAGSSSSVGTSSQLPASTASSEKRTVLDFSARRRRSSSFSCRARSRARRCSD